jgi:hypothetical protein
MRFSLSRWRAGHLLAAWSAYWVGLGAVTLTPIALAIYHATRAGSAPGTANVSASFGSAGLRITITRLGQTMLDRSAGLTTIALGIAVPPLVLWGAWLYARSRAIARGDQLPKPDGPAREALGEPAPATRRPDRDPARVKRSDPEA